MDFNVNVLIKVLKNIGLLCSVASIALLVGCDNNKQNQYLEFLLQSDNIPVNCNSSLKQQYQLSQFWFYLSSVQVKGDKGWHPVSLQATKWQTDGVALIGQHCRDNQSQNWQLALTDALPEKISAISFKIAVPFNLNHQNPLQAQGIFDNGNMFWTWQQGYKSLRLDLDNHAGEGWAYHIGAVGCNSPSAMRAPKQQCREPNHINVLVEQFDKNKAIKVDIGRIVQGIELGASTRCLSMPTQKSCNELNRNMNNKNTSVFYQ
ncbi:metallo-mystery pair system four-Cys motif protein [Psychrobium sp. MM17-31]|uniref:MbnP family copper-binding protein n=1 Tax=Psychrobium sp. MM17-31 TaxID=2917758 RepID=UPI001EF68775|nr:MbnP family copper-binding protein [Psychrobium sp. MM17-31]MCG7530932.1 metallo-mystery pair system four-Cys motif protein [Psychrobium sp. MM17-31]